MKKDFKKFTKRNVHKRRDKEASRRALMSALSQVGVGYDGVKIKYSDDLGYGGRKRSAPGEDVIAKGIFCGTKSSYGFVTLEGAKRDIMIPAGKTHGAIDGDYVEIAYHSFTSRDGEERTEGRVTRIVELGRRTVVGTLCEEVIRHGRRYSRFTYVEPDDRRLSISLRVRDEGGARLGDKVEVLLRRNGTSSLECDVIRVFGDSDSREANYEAILSECGIVSEFTEAELSLADQLAAEEISTEGREDLRSEMVFTIDGADAKDLDDAVSLRRLSGGGYRLGVHIADVSHYVRERTSLDRCVMQRGTSVYFTDKVVPMLPPALSNGACSLNCGEDKYAISALIKLDEKGEIIDVRLAPSVIKSRVRGVYSEVNLVLSGEGGAELKKKYSSVLPTLKKMEELYHILDRKNSERGSLDLEGGEAVIILNGDGNPVGIERRERGVAERIIEQFMLTANEAVATYLYNNNIPCVYRVHEAPPPDGYEGFINYLESLGFDVRPMRKKDPHPRILSALLEEAKDRGLGEAVSYTMLRAMAKAKYSEIHQSHFGLATDKYCHFTSPIRRLSDLATHRIIRRVIFEGKRAENYLSYARRAAAAATEGELRAISAERKIDALYKTIYMSRHIGDEFVGTVCSVTSFGMFVTLENTCEGLVPISEMPGLFTFDERNLILRSSRDVYRIADRVRVRLEEADLTRGKLRFSVLEHYK